MEREMIRIEDPHRVVPTTEGAEGTVEVSTGVSTRVGDLADLPVTRTLSWMVRVASHSSEGRTGGGDTGDTTPR
jgi:hypothetical protein